jgi:hypothetical protein
MLARLHLREVSHNIILNEVLGTEKGIKALAKFIQESNPFKKVDMLQQERDHEDRERVVERVVVDEMEVGWGGLTGIDRTV